jgi:transposase
MNQYIWVGMDVHQESITAAILEGDSHEVQVLKMSGDLTKVRRLFRRLSKRGPVRACYEATGAGFVLHRVLKRDGYHCEVIAPSLIPRKPGDRRLIRLRSTYQDQCKSTKRRIVGILRAHGLVFRGTKTLWTAKHVVWLRKMRRELQGPLQTALATELEHLEYLETQRNALDGDIEQFAQSPPYRGVVEALCCLRGVRTLTAMTLQAEIDDIHRFRSPRSLMAYFGLVPGERSSGERERRGSITRAGNAHVRRILVEAAWNNRHQAGAELILRRRREGQPPEVVAIAVKAQHRLSRKFHRLWRTKHCNVAVTAVARELCGFVWAIMKAAPQH